MHGLNQRGEINLLVNNFNFLNGTKYELGNKKLIRRSFSFFAQTSRSVLGQGLLVYLSQPFNIAIFSFLFAILFLVRPAFNMSATVLLISLFGVLSPLFHEFGHFYCARLLHSGAVLRINGLSLSVLYQARGRNGIMIALAGPLINIIFLVVILAMRHFVFSNYYQMFLSFLVFIQLGLALSLLPIFSDGKNIINHFMELRINRIIIKKGAYEKG